MTEAGNKSRVRPFPNNGGVSRKEFNSLEQRVTQIETTLTDISDIKEAVFKIARYIKVAVPSIISAAVAAGIVNGKIGAFLHALATGAGG